MRQELFPRIVGTILVAVSLEEVEKRAKDKVEMPKFFGEIRTEKQNPIKRFFSKLFGK